MKGSERGDAGGREEWKVCWGIREGEGRYGISVPVGKCVGMWGKMWESVWGERGEVCWGVGGGEEKSGKRYGGCGGR